MSRYDKDGMTLRERDIYNYIIQFKTINGISPSTYDISKALITSRSFVRRCLYNLEQKGFIRYASDKTRRNIIVIKLPQQTA